MNHFASDEHSCTDHKTFWCLKSIHKLCVHSVCIMDNMRLNEKINEMKCLTFLYLFLIVAHDPLTHTFNLSILFGIETISQNCQKHYHMNFWRNVQFQPKWYANVVFFFAFKGMGRKKRWWCGWGWEGECWSKWGHNLLLSNRPKLYMILRRMQWHCATHFTYTSYIAFFFFPFYPQKLTA